MLQKIKNKLIIISSVLLFAISLSVPVVVNAANNSAGGSNIQNQACAGATNLAIGTQDSTNSSAACSTSDSTSKVNSLLTTIINIFSVIVGVVAVIMIIGGGFKYITSGGDSAKVTSAKSTLLYALIGLVVVALAQVIVQFVLNKAITNAS